MDKNPSWEADSQPVGQQIPRPFMEHKDSLQSSLQHATVPCTEPY